jgi:hypothetical protein
VETYTSTVIENQFGDEPKTLEEAGHSPEWIHWEQAIQAELGQIYKRGTWSLVDKPKDAVPISNKWVFTRKYNKDGSLNKHKAQLVAKGCAQRPGYDYVETYSLVVRLKPYMPYLPLEL